MRTTEIKFDPPISLDDLPKIWIPEYRKNRYLRNLSDDEIRTRTHDLMMNGMRLGEDLIYRPHWITDRRGYYVADRGLDWLRLLTECWLEIGDYRGSRIDLKPRNGEIVVAQRLAAKPWAKRPDLVEISDRSAEYRRPNVLFRYSRKEWNEAFLKTGAARIVPAAHYDDTCHSYAVRDNEREKTFMDRNGDWWAARINNFYVSCFSMAFDFRYFADFNADSCVVIRDVPELTRRIVAAARKLPDLIGEKAGAPTIYYDPICTDAPGDGREIQFSKHFRYAYQREFRYCFTPKKPGELEPVTLCLGSLEDIGELVC